ncbi:MAG: hypothetical protein VB144_02055 [Clostridia bacterium]|nr:hypothetical protein [Clostridia bacterium]
MKRIALLLVCLIGLSVFLGPARAALSPRTHIINNLQDYLSIEKFGFAGSSELSVNATVKNAGPQSIEAYSLSFIFFDYFNEKCEAFSGYSTSKIMPDKAESASWMQSYIRSSPLTAFVWVRAIRLGDDTVLVANTDEVASRMSEVIKAPVSPQDLMSTAK